MNLKQIELPYDLAALEPYISIETMEYHYGKHYAGYLRKLAKAVEGTDFEDMPLMKIVCSATDAPFFNNAAQAWNHEFYFHCLTPNPKAKPTGALAAAIARDFGSIEKMTDEFRGKAAGLFGSGWTWLVLNGKSGLEIVTTENAQTPLTSGLTPLLTCDVWEHAYYIDYRNERPRYLENFFKIVDWDFVATNFEAARQRPAA